MQKFLLLYTLLSLIIGTRIDFDSADCLVFQDKFGSGVSKLAFSGHTSLIGNTADLEVKLSYSDFDYFNDPKFKGLVVQDGKTPETTCLDMKLLNSGQYFSEEVEVTDLTITPSENLTEKQRFYSFTIKGSEYAARMIETKNSDFFIYLGYYAIAFYAAETDQIFNIFYFGFSVMVDRETRTAVDLTFKPYRQYNNLQLQIMKIYPPQPKITINWCTDFTCSVFYTPDLHFKDQFVLLQKITMSEMANYYLTESEVWYTGYGLNKKATIQSFDNKTPGQVKLLLNAEIVWKAVSISVTSVLSTNPNGSKSILEQTTVDTVRGQTDEITCIKPEDSDVCSTCEQECDVNGFASDGCDSCSITQIISTFLLGSLIIIF